MTDKLEAQLRGALRPVPAPDDFTARLLRALPAPVTPAKLAVLPPREKPQRRTWQFGLPAALAASLLAAVLLGQYRSEQTLVRTEEQAGRAASLELMQALLVTSEKLDLAYQAVQSPPPSPESDEENRS